MNEGFPEVVAAVGEHLPAQTVVDGEIVRWSAQGRLDFGALQRRNAAGGRVQELAWDEPCHYVVFDVLETAEHGDLRRRPLSVRRRVLEDLFTGIPQVSTLALGMQTADRAVAEVWFGQLARVGVEGLVIKAANGRYRPGRREWLKYKHHDSTEVIVGGVTGSLQRPQEVIVGRYSSGTGAFRVVGRTTPLNDAAAAELAALLTAAACGEHPWPERLPAGWAGGLSGLGPPIDYVRVQPRAVVEVRVDVAAERGRWRHALRYLRPRPDLTPADVPLDLDLQP